MEKECHDLTVSLSMARNDIRAKHIYWKGILMNKKKIILIVVAVLVVVGVLAFLFWPWKSLAGEIRKAVGGNGKLRVVSVEEMPTESVDELHVVSLDADAPETAQILEEIERTKVSFLRSEVGAKYDVTAYRMELAAEEGGSPITLVVKDDGEIHLNFAEKTYRISNKESKLYELLQQIYQKLAS